MRTPEEHPDLATKRTIGAGARRAREIVADLRTGAATDVFDAFWQLDELPADDVREALAAWIGPLPDPEGLDTATRLKHGLPVRPLRLRTSSVARDADILDLGPVAEEQLRLAGKSWDGADLAPEERLDGEVEGSFAGTLERRVLADADSPGDTPVFDVVLFAEDSGVVFAAGTTNVVALIAYRKVEMRDRRTRLAIEEAVAPTETALLPDVVATAPGEPEAPPSAAPDEERPATRAKPGAKKAVVETAAAKRAAPKKAVAKKAAVKKAVVKTATAKKATAAKRVAKKAATVVKKTAKKKTVAAKRAGR